MTDVTPTFSTDLFGRLCEAVLARGYAAVRFDDVEVAGQKRFHMRHDVDISPRNALALGRIAASYGVRSNIFFQFNAETYQLFSPANLQIVRDLREMGHLVGLHIDQPLSSEDEDRIAATLEWFDTQIGPIDRAISFHRPTPAVLGRRYECFLSAYDPRFFVQDAYLSDSRRSLAFMDRFEILLDEGRPVVQLLLHPEWWSSLVDAPSVWRALQERRTCELRDYVGLNFTKVFADVEPIEDRDFGI